MFLKRYVITKSTYVAFLTNDNYVVTPFMVLTCNIQQQGRREGGFLGFRKPPSSHNTKLHLSSDITNDINDQTFEAQYSLGI